MSNLAPPRVETDTGHISDLTRRFHNHAMACPAVGIASYRFKHVIPFDP